MRGCTGFGCMDGIGHQSETQAAYSHRYTAPPRLYTLVCLELEAASALFAGACQCLLPAFCSAMRARTRPLYAAAAVGSIELFTHAGERPNVHNTRRRPGISRCYLWPNSHLG